MDQNEEAKSDYTSYTAQEKNRGTLKHQEAWGQGCWEDGSRWEWRPYEYKNVWISRKEERPLEESDPRASASPTVGGVQKAETPIHAKDGNSLVNFGEYHGWAYAEMLRGEPGYADYMYGK